MKKENPFLSFINKLNIKEAKIDMKFDSMKEIFHCPSKQIKSSHLLNYFSSQNLMNNNIANKEYSDILNKKKKKLNNISELYKSPDYFMDSKSNTKLKNIIILENNETSFNYNNKVGLNAPLSYHDLSYNNSYIESNNSTKKNFTKVNNKKISYNIFKELLQEKKDKKSYNEKNDKYDYNIFLNVDSNKKLYFNNNKNNIKTKKINSNKKNSNSIVNDINKMKNQIKRQKVNKNYSQMYGQRKTLNKEANNINYNKNKNLNSLILESDSIEMKKSNKSNNIKIKVLNTNSKNKINKEINNDENAKNNIGLFENLLIELRNVKSAINKEKSHTIYNISNSKNYIKIDKKENKINKRISTPNIYQNRNKNNVFKPNDSRYSSGNISINMDDINSSRNKSNNIHIKNTYNLTKKILDKKNKLLNINVAQNNNENIEKLLSESSSIHVSSFEEIKNEENNGKSKVNQINDIKKNLTTKTPQNKNIKSNHLPREYLIQIFEARKSITNDSEYIPKIPAINIYKREQIYKKNKEMKIENLRQKIIEKEISEIQDTPKINDNSKRISKNNLPIYERLEEIEKKKTLDLKKIKDIMIKENEINETTINQKCEKNFDKNNFNKWLILNSEWNKKKNGKIEKLKDSINNELENDENFNFIPVIDKNSEKIFNKNENLSKSHLIDRLLKKNNNKEALIKKEKSALSFIPKINKEYQIRNQYYDFMEEDQAELFHELKEKLENVNKKS